jgi:hypothetical protein
VETYLPFIKALLSEWYLFTLSNPLYAAVLASAVWLLTATLYSFRVAALKRNKAASEKSGSENLNAVQQQLQQTQEELAATTEQMDKARNAAQDEAQRALALEQLIYQRNQQVAGIIQSLATSFDLGERPLLASEDVKADSLWQQHDKVIAQLTERLRAEVHEKIELQKACQAETAKLVEKEALLEVLQTTLAAHTNQLSKLEYALEEQKAILQQQDNAQQALADTLKKYQSDATRPAEPKPEIIKAVEIRQQPIQLEEESPTIVDAPLAQPEQDHQVVQVAEEPPAELIRHEEAPIESAAGEETVVVAVPSDINPEPAADDEVASFISPDTEQQTVNLPAKGSLGKLKNLFGKTKQQSIKTEPRWAAKKTDGTLPSDTEQQADDEISGKAAKSPGKLKGLYSKFKSKGK